MTAWCSLLVSPGPRHYRIAARLGSHEPPPAQRWPGSTQLSLPPWAGHLRGEDRRKVKSKGVKEEERDQEERDQEVRVWCKATVWIWVLRGGGRRDGRRDERKKERRFKELRRWYPRQPDCFVVLMNIAAIHIYQIWLSKWIIQFRILMRDLQAILCHTVRFDCRVATQQGPDNDISFHFRELLGWFCCIW